jgi:hypothetical protein
MPIDVVPTQPVSFSLAACAALPLVLIALSHGALRIAAPGRRFLSAAGVTWLAWLAAMAVSQAGWVDMVSGFLLLASATLAGFTLWTLIAWGFTLSMLLALYRGGRTLSVEEWMLAHTRGKPIAAFARDRLGVLVRMSLADIRGGRVVMTDRRGRVVARIAAGLRGLFGLRR